MAGENRREILEKLKFELSFLEQGGYGRSVHTSWEETSFFQDSITCLNYGEEGRPHPCSECMLNDFVPESMKNETVPCHHIPLDSKGNTISNLDRGYNRASVQDAVVVWLRSVIAAMEAQLATEESAQEKD
jgi:hypothetical protein